MPSISAQQPQVPEVEKPLAQKQEKSKIWSQVKRWGTVVAGIGTTLGGLYLVYAQFVRSGNKEQALPAKSILQATPAQSLPVQLYATLAPIHSLKVLDEKAKKFGAIDLKHKDFIEGIEGKREIDQKRKEINDQIKVIEELVKYADVNYKAIEDTQTYDTQKFYDLVAKEAVQGYYKDGIKDNVQLLQSVLSTGANPHQRISYDTLFSYAISRFGVDPKGRRNIDNDRKIIEILLKYNADTVHGIPAAGSSDIFKIMKDDAQLKKIFEDYGYSAQTGRKS